MNKGCALQAVILAGGKGTRLRPVVADQPKVLAEVCGRPFLAFLLDQIVDFGLHKVVLCTGYLGEQIEARFGENYGSLSLEYSRETVPLGTGGALRFASRLLKSETVLVINGDSYSEIDWAGLYGCHCERQAEITMLLRMKDDTRRYGKVKVGKNGRVTGFAEKVWSPGPGLVNGGVYLISRGLLESIPEGRMVGLEQEMFPRWIENRFFGYENSGAFIDIGTPDSYSRAETFFDRLTTHE